MKRGVLALCCYQRDTNADPALKGKVVKGAAPEKKKLPPDSVLVAATLHFPLHRLTHFILMLEFLFQRYISVVLGVS